ncbi:aspartyl-phosphate phosphatase Spo0E family protein [Bacillus massiliigorillae]|uniref:aspartyl-phosphate phosphatase Spo0E family protein n=1 Tax=Bacillus massiliigorillae TaxID=1243664 RepID=UPI00039D82F6|nr:aspartyl-phosphate phosphatase Spo0E family protein [Bacillus massiliigorillae]
MMLAKLLHLSRRIRKLRSEMIYVASQKGLKDKEVVRISQDLDREIIVLQRIFLNK